MFIEDLIKNITHVCLPIDDRKLIASLARRIEEDTPVTTRQAFAAEKILRRNIDAILPFHPDANKYLWPVKWRVDPVPSRVTVPEARLVKGNIVALRCNTSPDYRDALKELNAAYGGFGINLVTVTSEKSLSSLIALLGQEKFHIDDALETYLAEAMFCTTQNITVTENDNRVKIEVPCNNLFAEYCNQVLEFDE